MRIRANRLGAGLLALITTIRSSSDARLIAFDATHRVLDAFENIDYMHINATTYGTVRGKMAIAAFANDSDQHPCAVLPIPPGIDVLVVPFEYGLSLGCESYANIISANGWLSGEDGSPVAYETDVVSETTMYTTTVPVTLTDVDTTTLSDGRVVTTTRTSTTNSVMTTSSVNTITRTKSPTDTTQAPASNDGKSSGDGSDRPASSGDSHDDDSPAAAPGASHNSPSPAPTESSNDGGSSSSNSGGGSSPNSGGQSSGDSSSGGGGSSSDPQPAPPPAETTTAAKSTSSPLINAEATVGGVATASVALLRRRAIQKRAADHEMPKVVVFTSANGGVPGIKEVYSGNRNVLQKAAPGITLMRFEDVARLQSIAPIVSDVELTSDEGPWLRIVNSSQWIAWTTIMCTGYGLIIVLGIVSTIKTYRNIGCMARCTKFYIYPAIMFISTVSIVALAVSPADIFENRMTMFTRAALVYFKQLMLVVIFALVEFMWKAAAKRMCNGHDNHPRLAHRTSSTFTYLIAFCILAFVVNFVVRMVGYANPTQLWVMRALRITAIIDNACLSLLAIEFVVFGYLMVSSLRKRVVDKSLHQSRQRTALKILIMVIALVIAISFSITSTELSFLSITVPNFWISQIGQNVATAASSIIIILVLRDRTIGRNLKKDFPYDGTDEFDDSSGLTGSSDRSHHDSEKPAENNGNNGERVSWANSSMPPSPGLVIQPDQTPTPIVIAPAFSLGDQLNSIPPPPRPRVVSLSARSTRSSSSCVDAGMETGRKSGEHTTRRESGEDTTRRESGEA